MYSSTYKPTYLQIYPSIYLSIDLSIYLSTASEVSRLATNNIYVHEYANRERERERAHTYVRFTDDMLKHTARVLVHVYMRDFQSAQTYTCKMYIFTSMHIIIIYIYIFFVYLQLHMYVYIYTHYIHKYLYCYICTCVCVHITTLSLRDLSFRAVDHEVSAKPSQIILHLNFVNRCVIGSRFSQVNPNS